MSFAIGIQNTKDVKNVGGLWRSAYNFGASMIFTIGHRYKYDPSDTTKASRTIPLVHFLDWKDFIAHAPKDWIPVVVELIEDATPLPRFKHPKYAVYILGPEDGSIDDEIYQSVKNKIVIPTRRCLNVAVTGAVVMYDRMLKDGQVVAQEIPNADKE